MSSPRLNIIGNPAGTDANPCQGCIRNCCDPLELDHDRLIYIPLGPQDPQQTEKLPEPVLNACIGKAIGSP